MILFLISHHGFGDACQASLKFDLVLALCFRDDLLNISIIYER